MTATYLYLRNQTVVWGRENYDRLGSALNLETGDKDVYLSNAAGVKLTLDMRCVSPVIKRELDKSFQNSSQVYQSKSTAYWGLYLPIRATSAEDAFRRLPEQAQRSSSDFAPSVHIVKKLYMAHEDGGIVINSVGRKLRTQSASEYFTHIDKLNMPFIQTMAAYEKQVVPTLERNPLVAVEQNTPLSPAELEILEQAIHSSNAPVQNAKLAIQRVTNLSDQSIERLFLSYPEKDLLTLISTNPNILMTKPLIEQVMHTSRRPLLEFQIPSSWISVGTIVQTANSIKALKDLKLAETFSRWKLVVNSQNRMVSLCKDHIIDLITSLNRRGQA